MHFSYERYLMNCMRQAFGFTACPIRLKFSDREHDFSVMDALDPLSFGSQKIKSTQLCHRMPFLPAEDRKPALLETANEVYLFLFNFRLLRYIAVPFES